MQQKKGCVCVCVCVFVCVGVSGLCVCGSAVGPKQHHIIPKTVNLDPKKLFPSIFIISEQRVNSEKYIDRRKIQTTKKKHLTPITHHTTQPMRGNTL